MNTKTINQAFAIMVTYDELSDPLDQLEEIIEKVTEGFSSGESSSRDLRTGYEFWAEQDNPDEPFTWLAHIQLRDGDYLTGFERVVKADSEEEARLHALQDCCHCDLGSGAYFGDHGIYDRHGEVHYEVRSIQKLDVLEAGILSRLGM